MGLVPIFHATVSEDGARLVFEEREARLRQGHLKKHAGKRMDVVVRVHRNQRSQKQNRWHWGIAIPLLAAELGYDKHEHEALHYALVAKCFGTVYDARMQQEVPNVRSSDLTTVQFSQLMEWEVRFAATEYGVHIPLPNEAEWDR